MFRPSGPVKRMEAVVILWRAVGRGTSSHQQNIYNNVFEDIASAFDYLVELGVLTAEDADDGNFDIFGLAAPEDLQTWIDRFMTRAELAELLAEEFQPAATEEEPFEDIGNCTDKQQAAINALAAAGILNGTAQGKFAPYAPVTRQQAVMVICRAATGNPSADYETSLRYFIEQGILTEDGAKEEAFKPAAAATREVVAGWLDGRPDDPAPSGTVREVGNLDELKEAAKDNKTTKIIVTGEIEVNQYIVVPQKIEVDTEKGGSLTITSGEYGSDVTEYLKDKSAYIASPLRKNRGNGSDGSKEMGNLVDDVYVVYKKVTSFQEMLKAENDPTVGGIYIANDIYATRDDDNKNVTITKPIEIGWNESTNEHYDLKVFMGSVLTVTAPFQRFGFEKIGRVDTQNFREFSKDGIQWLMRGDETRELYGTLTEAMWALSRAQESTEYYDMVSLTGEHTVVSSKYGITNGVILRITSEIRVKGMFMVFGNLLLERDGALIAERVWLEGGLAYKESAKNILEGYGGMVIIPGEITSDEWAEGSSSVTTETTRNQDGSVTTTTTNKKTGITTETKKTPSGVTGTTVTNRDGEITNISAFIPTAAAKSAEKSGETITLPLEITAEKSAGDAPAIRIDIPANTDSLTVKIPVANVTSGTVAVIVHADGSEETIKTSGISGNGVLVTLEKDTTVKIVDNSQYFQDVHGAEHWAQDSIDFVTSRELFTGKTEDSFAPNAPTTRAQLMTVLARLDNADTSAAPLQQGMEWAVEKGISDGSNPNGNISRQQLAVMLWRYAGSPASDYELAHSDAGSVSGYAQTAMQWAVENGIMSGTAQGTLNPAGTASRAHVAAMVARYCANIA